MINLRFSYIEAGKLLSNMKKHIKIFLFVITVFLYTSCGSFANMSYDDAYDIGYGIGTAARYLIDN